MIPWLHGEIFVKEIDRLQTIVEMKKTMHWSEWGFLPQIIPKHGGTEQLLNFANWPKIQYKRHSTCQKSLKIYWTLKDSNTAAFDVNMRCIIHQLMQRHRNFLLQNCSKESTDTYCSPLEILVLHTLLMNV